MPSLLKRKKEPLSERDRLVGAVERTARALEKQNSLPRKFAHGIVLGIGTAIGASVIAGIVVLILGNVLRYFGIEVME